MQRFALLLVILSVPPAYAEAGARCGTDAFGNTVCMDKDGVISIAPRTASGDNAAGKSEGGAGSGSADAKAGEQKQPRRCGVDPFGNTVCN